jgi:hypothetical protein
LESRMERCGGSPVSSCCRVERSDDQDHRAGARIGRALTLWCVRPEEWPDGGLREICDGMVKLGPEKEKRR